MANSTVSKKSTKSSKSDKSDTAPLPYSFKHQRNLNIPDTNYEGLDVGDKSQSPIEYDQITSLEEYAKNGRKTNTVIGNKDVVRFGNGFLAAVSANGCIYDHALDNIDYKLSDGNTYFGNAVEMPHAFIMKDGTVLEDGEGGEAIYDGHPTFSPTVLASLIAGKDMANAATKTKVSTILNANNLKVLDSTTAFEQTASAEIKKDFTRAKKDEKFSMVKFNERWKKSAPQLGVTLVSGDGSTADLRWHSSPTVLFQHNSRYYILGQDEGSYFGCELEGSPQTIEEAFEDLKPVQVRGKSGVLRQGEWFAVPEPKSAKHDMSNYYNNPNVVAILDYDQDTSFVMPKESEDSNDHVLIADCGVILKDGTILAQGFSMRHNDHAELKGADNVWYTFYRNTAKGSYSTQGVD